MNQIANWPNHKNTVMIAGVVSALFFLMSVILFFGGILPTLKQSVQVREQQITSQQSELPISNKPITSESKEIVASSTIIKERANEADYYLDIQEPAKVVVIAEEIVGLAVNEKEQALGYYYLGYAHAQLGKFTKAKDEINQSIKLNDSFAQSYNVLSHIYLQEGDLEVGIDYAKEALQYDSQNAWSHNLLGSAYIEKGWLALAINEFEEAVRLSPDNRIFQSNLKRVKAL